MACPTYQDSEELADDSMDVASTKQVMKEMTGEESQLFYERLGLSFLQYVAQYWGCHVRESAEQPVLDRVLAFFQSAKLGAHAIQTLFATAPPFRFNRQKRTLLKDPPLHLAIFFSLRLTCAAILKKRTTSDFN